MDGFECQQEDLELDTELDREPDREPVKLLEDWSDVMDGGGSGNDSGS